MSTTYDIAAPVAWMNAEHVEKYRTGTAKGIAWANQAQTHFYTVPLYTAPPAMSANQAIEDAATVADKCAVRADRVEMINAFGLEAAQNAVKLAEGVAQSIRALRQPASDTPDPRDAVIAELREALEALVACDLCNGSLGLADSADADGRPYQSQQLADQLEAARAALAKAGEGAGDA